MGTAPPDKPTVPAASIVIASKNRRDELAAAVASAVAQSCSPEVIVIDDGSTDGTAAMIRAQFPSVRLVRSEQSRGYIAQRNHGAAIARAGIIISIDDDAEFTTERVVAQTLADFDDPRIGAVAIPYFEPRKHNRLYQTAPDDRQIWVTSHFIGTAHALRRDLFMRLGGYCEALFHQGEESDFALRMLAAGYYTRLGRADPIRHWESPRRDFQRMDYFGPRNSILFAWRNTPMAWLPLNMLATTAKCLALSLAPERLRIRAAGLWAGYRDSRRIPRQPVSSGTFRLWRQLRRQGSRRLADLTATAYMREMHREEMDETGR